MLCNLADLAFSCTCTVTSEYRVLNPVQGHCSADGQVWHALRDSTVVPLYKALPSPRLAQSSVSTEVPECETALSTLPALGTAKHRLSQLQQADLERKQAEVTAQRKAAAERKAQLAQQLAEKEKEVRRKQEREARQADHDKVEDAKQRMKAAEARQQQRLLKEREAQEQQKRAAKAAKDAARWGPMRCYSPICSSGTEYTTACMCFEQYDLKVTSMCIDGVP